MAPNSFILFIMICYIFSNQISFGDRAARQPNATISDLTYFPCMVEIINNDNKHVCGGCVLNEENVLTSAKCVKNFVQGNGKTNLKVRGGDVLITRKSLPTFQIRDVRKFVVHPDYNEASLENDLALLKIKDPFMPTANLHPVDAGVTSPKGRCFLPGWVDNSANTTMLHYITLYITNANKCTKKVKNSICAESKTSEGACKSDYGGPLVCGRKVFGVFIGPEDACEGKPALFTNISPFEDWIDLNIHQEEKMNQPSGGKLNVACERIVDISVPIQLMILIAIACRRNF